MARNSFRPLALKTSSTWGRRGSCESRQHRGRSKGREVGAGKSCNKVLCRLPSTPAALGVEGVPVRAGNTEGGQRGERWGRERRVTRCFAACPQHLQHLGGRRGSCKRRQRRQTRVGELQVAAQRADRGASPFQVVPSLCASCKQRPPFQPSCLSCLHFPTCPSPALKSKPPYHETVKQSPKQKPLS